MRTIKKSIALILTFLCIFSQTISAYASNGLQGDDTANILYINGYSETINIDGHYYTYEFYITDDGNRGMDIMDDVGETIAQLEYNESTFTTFLNGEVWSVGESADNINTLANDNWIYFSSVDHYITWAEGATVAVIAGIIAIGVGFIGPEMVIAAMGMGALSIIAGLSPGGRVNATIYKFNSSFVNQFKVIWMFCDPLGKWYGPYTNIIN